MVNKSTVEIHRLNQYVLDWATAVAGEAYRELTHVSFTLHISGPILYSLVQSMNFYGKSIKQKKPKQLINMNYICQKNPKLHNIGKTQKS